MSKIALEIGDVVRLKAGGPKMTVENIVMFDVHCVWFPSLTFTEYSAHPVRERFRFEALEKVLPEGATDVA